MPLSSSQAGVADLVDTKKLDLIATFGEARDEQFPQTPTVVESGYPSVIVVGWSGLFAPAGVPPQIVGRIYDGMAKALSSKSPQDFARYIKSEAEKFHPVIKAAGLEGSQ